MRSSISIILLAGAAIVATTFGCLQADTESGDDVIYANHDGPPTHLDAGDLDAGPEEPDALTAPEDWEAPESPDADSDGDDDDDPPDFDDGETIGPDDRPATVLLPDDYDPTSTYPVVFLLHSYTMTASIQDSYFGLSDRRHDRQFITVLPEGRTDATGQQFWNATDYCCDFYGSDPDDVAYFGELLDDLFDHVSADPERVHLVGHSNGAFMNYRLACEYGSDIASIVGLAGSGHAAPSTCDEPDGTVSVLHIHGSHDAVIYYNGVIGAYPGARTMTRRWSERNDCSTSSSIDDYISLDGLIMGTETSRRRYDDCPRGVDVEFWTILMGAHVPNLTSNFADRVLDFSLPKTNVDGAP